MPSRLTRVSAALLSLLASVACADEHDVAFNGFINIVGGILKDEPRSDFSEQRQVPNYQDNDDQLAFDPHSSAGLQAKKRLDEKTAVTLQLYAEGDNDQYKATMKWLYLTYEPTYNSSFRIGKLATPLYYYSDYLNVGYAYHWITPPESVYPFDTSFEGISYVYQNQWGSIDWSTEVLMGAADDYFPVIDSRIITRNNRGIALNLSSQDTWSLRAMLLRTDATYEVDALAQDNLDSIVIEATDTALNDAGLSDDVIAAIRNDLIAATSLKLQNGALDLEEIPVTYGDLAIRYETDQWFLMNEIIIIRTDTYLYHDLLSAFITGGFRVGDALFHLTLMRARANPHDDISADRANTTPASLSTDAVADVLASQIRTRLASAFLRHRETASVGVRFETSANTAVKFEITRFEELSSFEGDNYGVGTNTLFRAALNATF